MPTLTKLFSMEETAEHNTKDDCWIVIDGKVYDVTTYLDDHPGGDDVLLEAIGKDAKDDFEDAGHSEDARDLMEKFFVGELDPTAATIPETKDSSKKKKEAKSDDKGEGFPYLYWAAPIAAIGISVLVGFLLLRNKLRRSS